MNNAEFVKRQNSQKKTSSKLSETRALILAEGALHHGKRKQTYHCEWECLHCNIKRFGRKFVWSRPMWIGPWRTFLLAPNVRVLVWHMYIRRKYKNNALWLVENGPFQETENSLVPGNCLVPCDIICFDLYIFCSRCCLKLENIHNLDCI